ncbi:MAG TPA: nodulation protein NfeD [Candidatus Limnocylindrales bacterium]|jgi:Membrane-bound serine protease (ClpP class)|nr:nodulation protein NfeD [Candidatus Limnocylindrales bacterium]
MSDSHIENGSDVEMEGRLRRLAADSGTPPLPDETAALPWTVQQERAGVGVFDVAPVFAAGVGALRRSAFAFARLAATLVVAGAFLGLVGMARTSGGGGGAIIVQSPPTPRPTGSVAALAGPEVVVVPTSGVVDAVMADHVAGAIHRAESDGAAAVIIQLDTLGGSEDAMLRIDAALHSKIPTIVWVGPSGAKAASAGTFITLSANLAYMAPSTNIGAASPVAAGGADIATAFGQTEADKVMNDAIATMRSIAQERHPNSVAWAVSTVEQAKSYTAQEAVDAHAVNGIATSIDDVLNQADGQTVTTSAGSVVVHTKGATTVSIGEDPIQWFLHSLDDPNIAFILLVIGVLCVLIEFFHPTLLMGLVGAVSLALSFYGSGSLPLNILGVILVVLGIFMLVFESTVPSHGLLTVGGLASFLVGAVAFYGSPGPYLPGVAVAWPIIIAMTMAAALYGLFLVRTLLQMRHLAVPAGSGMVGTIKVVGQTGEVQADLVPTGTVYVGGESWTARTSNGQSVARGSHVRVIRQEGLTLIVERVE